MLTSAYDVGFYSFKCAMVFGDTSDNVDEVLVHVFFFCLFPQLWTTYTLLTVFS